MNARSEFVEPTNFSDGAVLEIKRRFHDASPARSRMRAVAESRRPGLSPTRGSGLGADVDMFGAGDALGLEDIVDDDEAHAFTYSAPTASEANRNGAAGRR